MRIYSRSDVKLETVKLNKQPIIDQWYDAEVEDHVCFCCWSCCCGFVVDDYDHFNPLEGNWFFLNDSSAFQVFEMYEDGYFGDLTLDEALDKLFDINFETGWLPKLSDAFKRQDN